MSTSPLLRFLLTGLALLAACPAAQVKPPPPPPPVIVGAWQSGCLPIKNADDTDGTARFTWGITPTLWALDVQLFGDDACAAPTATIHSDGGWAMERPSGLIPGAWDIRFDVRTRTLTPHVEGFIAYLQSMSCGDGYGVERAADMLDVGCPALGLQPFSACQTEFDVVASDGATLRFGARAYDRDRCAERARPPSLGVPLARLQ